MGLVHGSCWPDAEEPGVKYYLKGKGATRDEEEGHLAMRLAKARSWV